MNTGWTGGAYGIGARMPIKETRALLSAALDGSLNSVEFRTDAHFGFEMPVSVPNVDSSILNPRDTWADGTAYDAQARKLVDMFVANFEKFMDHVGEDVRSPPLPSRRSKGLAHLCALARPAPTEWRSKHPPSEAEVLVLLVRLVPVFGGFGFHHQRHREFKARGAGLLHGFFNTCHQRLRVVFRHFKNQLIMHLQQHFYTTLSPPPQARGAWQSWHGE